MPGLRPQFPACAQGLGSMPPPGGKHPPCLLPVENGQPRPSSVPPGFRDKPTATAPPQWRSMKTPLGIETQGPPRTEGSQEGTPAEKESLSQEELPLGRFFLWSLFLRSFQDKRKHSEPREEKQEARPVMFTDSFILSWPGPTSLLRLSYRSQPLQGWSPGGLEQIHPYSLPHL